MRRVWVSAWEMQCCGEPFQLGSTVSWTVTAPSPNRTASVLPHQEDTAITDVEGHHFVREEWDGHELHGTVRAIQAVVGRFTRSAAHQQLYEPVPASAILTSLSEADGEESKIPWHPHNELRFVGYLVDVEATDVP